MQIFYTRKVDVERIGPCLPQLADAAADAIARAGTATGILFVLRPDGAYDHVLNRFFRKLPHIGVPKPNSWRAYAMQIMAAALYVEGPCGRSHLLKGTLDDFESFKMWRRNPDEPQIAASSWNVQVAALDLFFRWAESERLIAKSPFLYRQRIIRVAGRSEIREVNALYDPVSDDDVVRCISLEEYRFFRDHGLGGSGRNAVRDRALAEYMVTTGMRITETLVTLRRELPLSLADRSVKSSPVVLPGAITKRSRSRRIFVSHRVLDEHVDEYDASDRAHAVAQARKRGRYHDIDDVVLVESVGTGGVEVRTEGGTKHRTFASLGVDERRRLWVASGDEAVEPLVLWLGEGGFPLDDAAVRMTFRRACARCNEGDEARRRYGRAMEVSPHTLRHTFAIAHLNQLIREAGLRIRHVGGARNDADEDHERMRRVLMNPLDQLRARLGHSSIETTFKYLTYLEEAQAAAYAAVEGWDRLLTSDKSTGGSIDG